MRMDAEPQTNPYRQEPVEPVREAVIPAGEATLRGELRWAGRPRGVVVFAHGSGSSRHSPRNRFVADALTRAAELAGVSRRFLQRTIARLGLRSAELDEDDD